MTSSSATKHSRHPDFKTVEKSRPPFNNDNTWKVTQTPLTEWKVGDGANSTEWKNHKKVSVDPYGEGRSTVDNYKTLISAINPRPVGFVSSIDKNGVRNLAPFSFFNVVNIDPPIFVLGFSANGGNLKDTCKNILETGELTINIISEWFVEAANFCSVNAPPNSDEWDLSGLTPVESEVVKAPHVAESAFSVEAKLVNHYDWKSKKNPDLLTGTTILVEGVKFHIREDVTNDEFNLIDIAKLQPVSRLGGITYGRTVDGYELARPEFDRDVAKLN